MRNYWLAAILAVASLIVGCGGGDSTAGSSGGGESAAARGGGAAGRGEATGEGGGAAGGGEAPGEGAEAGAGESGRTAFVSQANGICEGTKRKFEAGAKAVVEKTGGKEDTLALVESALVPALEDEVEELRQLEVPQGDEKEVEAIFAAIEKVVAKAKQSPKTIAGEPYPYQEIESLGSRYGLTSCPID